MEQRLNDDWLFAKLPTGSTLNDAHAAAFRPVDLPHDWLIGQTEDLYESAEAWYARKLNIRNTGDGLERILSFDGVYMDCDVLVNGEVVCTHPYGYTAFYVPLNGRLHSGENELMVHIRHQSPNSRWYSGSGIYRDVTLLTLPRNHLVPDGILLYTEEYACLRKRPEETGFRFAVKRRIRTAGSLQKRRAGEIPAGSAAPSGFRRERPGRRKARISIR